MTTDLTEITVVGDDDTGLVARVTTLLFERGCNIEDVDQAVQDGLFRMTALVSTDEMVCKPATLREDLQALGEELGVDVRVRFPTTRDTPRLAILVTHESHALRALLSADLDAEIAFVAGNRPDLEPVAAAHDVPFHHVGDDRGVPDDDRLLELLDDADVDLVALARYMRILPPEIVFRYEGRIVNVHPSLLPAFPGAEAYRQALEAGVRIAGVTAHYVTTDLDGGPIVAQRAFDVPPDAELDDLKTRGQPLEAAVLVEAVRAHLADDLRTHRGRTRVRGDDYQLGLPEAAQAANPDGPVDGEGPTTETAAEAGDVGD